MSVGAAASVRDPLTLQHTHNADLTVTAQNVTQGTTGPQLQGRKGARVTSQPRTGGPGKLTPDRGVLSPSAFKKRGVAPDGRPGNPVSQAAGQGPRPAEYYSGHSAGGL
jgi:hypothetical protein